MEILLWMTRMFGMIWLYALPVHSIYILTDGSERPKHWNWLLLIDFSFAVISFIAILFVKYRLLGFPFTMGDFLGEIVGMFVSGIFIIFLCLFTFVLF